jgi:hypothetical protein
MHQPELDLLKEQWGDKIMELAQSTQVVPKQMVSPDFGGILESYKAGQDIAKNRIALEQSGHGLMANKAVSQAIKDNTNEAGDLDVPTIISQLSKDPNASLNLPESVLLKPTEEKIQPYSEPHASALNDIKVSVKIKPEDALNKANQVGKNLDLIKKDVEDISSQLRNPDSRLTTRDNYEEKITIPAENLIFENRKNRMTQHPDWK